MPGSVRVSGLDELRSAFRVMRQEVTPEASRIVDATANAAAVEIRAEYGSRRRTGKLQESVVVERRTSGAKSHVVVRAKAAHAHLVEYGTQARHTDIGANRGSMPATPIVGRVAPKHRRRMYDALKAILQRTGAVVSGEP